MEGIEDADSFCNSIDRTVEIERLASLDPIDYEVARGAAAGRMGIRTAVLDGQVKKKRRELGLETASEDVGQGRAVKIEDILPWPDDIEGDRVASGLSASLKNYVVLSEAAADAIALWVLHTWLVDDFTISPRLAITSPTKGCGKTTLLRFLTQVARRPKRAGSISPPALFRAVEQFHPTVILDETEKYIEHGSDLHALLNEGHCKGGTVLRVLGEKQELREFSVFAAVAFAANGRLPDRSGYRYNSAGQLLLESKQDMRKRGVPSPDEGDAVALCFADPLGGAGPTNFYRDLKKEYEKRGVYI